MHGKCPRCGSDKIIPEVPFLDRYGDFEGISQQAKVKVHGAPDALLFKDTVAGKLSLRICGACGHADLQVSKFQELYEKYRASCHLDPTAPWDKEEDCLSCRKPIPINETRCPSCGWSWGDEVKTST